MATLRQKEKSVLDEQADKKLNEQLGSIVSGFDKLQNRTQNNNVFTETKPVSSIEENSKTDINNNIEESINFSENQKKTEIPLDTEKSLSAKSKKSGAKTSLNLYLPVETKAEWKEYFSKKNLSLTDGLILAVEYLKTQEKAGKVRLGFQFM